MTHDHDGMLADPDQAEVNPVASGDTADHPAQQAQAIDADGQQSEQQVEVESESTLKQSALKQSALEQSTLKQSDSKRFGFAKGLLLGTTFMATATLSAVLGAIVAFTVPLAEAIAPQDEPAASVTNSMVDLWKKGIRHQVVRPVNILVMGIDQTAASEASAPTLSKLNQGKNTTELDNTHHANDLDLDPTDKFSGRSDTMLLVQVDPDEQTVNILSIPRDTQAEFPGYRGVTKINHANLIGGPRLAAKVVSHNLNGVSVDRYVRVNTAAFRELVDALGGVEVLVPQPMKYTDQTQGLYIDLEEGRQILNGDEAEQFARFRNDGNGDIGRVQRQQQLIQALRDRIMTSTVLPRIPTILQLLRDHIDTNLTPEELLALLNFALELEPDQLRMVMLPGTFSQAGEYIASYWLMDTSAVNRIMADYFNVRPQNLVAQLGIVRQEDSSLKSLRIVIQNASGNAALAYQLTKILREDGFANVYRQSWSGETQSQTQIIVQRGDLKGAEALRDTLGIGTVVSASTGVLISDLTIRIGEDWPLSTDEE